LNPCQGQSSSGQPVGFQNIVSITYLFIDPSPSGVASTLHSSHVRFTEKVPRKASKFRTFLIWSTFTSPLMINREKENRQKMFF
jgi:hypothetical protein